MKTLVVECREQWQEWLEEHHTSVSEVWLVFFKQRLEGRSLSYEEAVEEALCFGWIDSLIKRLDDARYVRKFTPRKADSRWSTANRLRYARLQAAGKLTPAGLRRAPTDKSGDAPRPSDSAIPADIEQALKAHQSAAWKHFQELSPSCRRAYIGWIDSAKKPETRLRRLREALSLMAAGKKLGMK